jgi:hypothetical protein
VIGRHRVHTGHDPVLSPRHAQTPNRHWVDRRRSKSRYACRPPLGVSWALLPCSRNELQLKTGGDLTVAKPGYLRLPSLATCGWPILAVAKPGFLRMPSRASYGCQAGLLTVAKPGFLRLPSRASYGCQAGLLTDAKPSLPRVEP